MEKYLKKAASVVNAQMLRKTAGIRAQMFADIPATALSGLIAGPSVAAAGIGAAQAGGAVSGALKDEPDLKRIVELDEKPWYKSLLPGFTHSDMMERLRYQTKGTKAGRKHILAENYGAAIRMLAAGIAGGILGKGKGAMLGAGLMGVGEAGASLAAAFTKRRSAEEQREKDNSNALLAALTPMGSYDFWKRRGLLIDEADKREELRKLKA